ncbi:MAG: hypothetical protein IT209_04310 [Armatimonadetes bacterium]|nr:hypothetical protein [Armatimonadota bacterium]
MPFRSSLKKAFAVVGVTALAAPAFSYSIVNVPTANQAALHEFNIAYYNMSVRKLPVTHKDIYIGYSTVAPNLELEWIHVDINKGAPSQDIVNATYKILAETPKLPDVVLGVKNIFSDDNSPDPDEQKASYYIATAKTLNPPKPGQPWHPVVRLHVNYGTREHRGLFGGLQIAITPRLGVAAMKFTNSHYVDTFFGNSSELAAVYSLGKNAPNIKAGTLGHHRWVGIDYSLHY